MALRYKTLDFLNICSPQVREMYERGYLDPKTLGAAAAKRVPAARVAASKLKAMASVRFKAKLFRYPGKGGWTFAIIPAKYAPPVTHQWGRTPVRADVDGHVWNTSVWRGKNGRVLLAIPKSVRGTKGDGSTVTVRLAFR